MYRYFNSKKFDNFDASQTEAGHASFLSNRTVMDGSNEVNVRVNGDKMS